MARPARPTCEGCLWIDVRRWHREGRLHAGRHFMCSWTCGGEPFGGIRVRAEADAMVLMFRSRNSQDSEWKAIKQRVPITWTFGTGATFARVDQMESRTIYRNQEIILKFHRLP
jgi:hypothetical protein